MKTTNQTRANQHFLRILIPLFFLFTGYSNSFGLNVTDLKATYSNGQIFLTWTNPNQTNLQYKVYRSTTKFSSSANLTSSKYIGFVRDNSAKNLHFSDLKNSDVYFKIKTDAQPLTSKQGLYVVTCTTNQPYYYAVTVTTLSNGSESKVIVMGQNSLSSGISEVVARPLPVLQENSTSNGEVKNWYVQFVNNQETPLYPAMNSTGSYGFNFYLTKRGNATKYPLMVVFEGAGTTLNTGVGLDASVTDCYIIGVFDWLPIPSGGGEVGKGDNTYFSGYHENFNIYSDNNPIPKSGTVKMYVQTRIMDAVHWAQQTLPIDPVRVYTKGLSSSGYGALLCAMIHPKEIAACYSIVEPMFVSPIGSKGQLYLQMWGEAKDELKSDIHVPNESGFLPAYTVLDNRQMVNINRKSEMPLVFDVHGKKDKTITWSPWIIEWYDSLENNHVGGVFYWDQRDHSGNGKNFENEETTPDFYRYQTNKSYPAFSHCTVDQNPGNGTSTNGDPFGALNGYLDWDDDITDNKCDYTITVMVKNQYVGGGLGQEQYTTCKTDITFRNQQNFHPVNGASINWKNYNDDNDLIQSGSLNYGDGPITLKAVTVNKSGNRIELKINSCQRVEGSTLESPKPQMFFTHSSNGYTAHVDVIADQNSSLYVYDLMGRVMMNKKVYLQAGSNDFEIPAFGSGIFIIELRSDFFTDTKKLFF